MSNTLKPETAVLVLQSGSALGAYQVCVYEALATAGVELGWIASISIYRINAAIIAGIAIFDLAGDAP